MTLDKEPADLSLTSALDPATVAPGTPATLTYTLADASDAAAGPATVQISPAAGVTLAAQSAPGGSYDAATHLWSVTGVPAHVSTTLVLSVVPSLSGSYPITAEVATAWNPDPDSTPGDHDPDEDDYTSLSLQVGSATAPGGSLNGVSCLTPGFCAAVGSDANGAPLVDVRTGGTTGTWQPATSHLAADVTPSAVSCASSSWCVAAGQYTDQYVDPIAVSELWNGSAWSLVSMAAPDPTGDEPHSYVDGISCPTTSSCVAVGQHQPDPELALQPLAETFNGTRWSLSGTAIAGPGILNAVSCTSPSSCLAVGLVGNFADLAEAWNGSRWSVTTPPGLDPATADLTGVSCLPATCLTTGWRGDYPGTGLLAASLSGSTWAVGNPADPAGSVEAFGAVSCASSTFCVAVGSYGSAPDRLAETWDGTTWSPERT